MKTQLHQIIGCFLCLVILFAACQKDELNTPQCTQVATYYSTATCSGEVAIDVGGTLLNVDNFSDYTTIEDYILGDSISIDYTVIQTAPDGLLCGVFVVADLIELSCFERIE